MELHNLENRKRGGYTTFGSVWNKGEVKEEYFKLLNEQGKEIPVQSRVTAWWPDRSIKWAAHTANSKKMGESVMLKPCSSVSPNESDGSGIKIKKEFDEYMVNAGKLQLKIPMGHGNKPDYIAKDILFDDVKLVNKAYPVLWLEQQLSDTFTRSNTSIFYIGRVDSVELEEEGSLQCVFCFRGSHVEKNSIDENEYAKGVMPFIIRMYVNYNSEDIRFVHTFLYDGKEEQDYLKGMGIQFDMTLTGKNYNRHIQFGTDKNVFHETALMLSSWYPRIQLLEEQMKGNMQCINPDSQEGRALSDIPVWNRYSICQDSISHYAIKKQTKKICCELEGLHGIKSPGTMVVNGENGGCIIAIKDFWEKYPSGLEVDNLTREVTKCTAWFYSPESKAMDFRHYDTRGYQLTSYEGYDEVGASAYGIGVTSECSLKLTKEVPSEKEITQFGNRIRKPAVYIATPEYYHSKKALGYWSLSKNSTESERWIEEQLSEAAEYYKEQIVQRSWYGLFDYGDVMHTYDPVRHCWKYDVGGFAWQNTELVPTIWLWLYFLRTGREDIYTLAEAMSRHCSEIDMYHFGPLKGIGSRHNVRHWGDSCKEPRIAMAGHHRGLYYLTGDRRIGEVMDEVKDADKSMVNIKHFTRLSESDPLEKVVRIRTGPDWSSFVSNWMTFYERTLDEIYLMKIKQGISDIGKAPMKLVSGPGFLYDSENAKLIYEGENEGTPNMHLQICMGAPQIWFEMVDMLGDTEFKDMLIDYGKFYFLSTEEKNRITNNLIGKRKFNLPYFASTMAAYSAHLTEDKELANTTWKLLLHALVTKEQMEGFKKVTYAHDTQGYELTEIPWLKTNFASQWCLNVIMTLEFIPETLPMTLEEVKELIKDMPITEGFHQA